MDQTEAPAGVLAALAEQDDEALPLRGVAARVVENMVASLGIPTATSVHPIPAKLIDANRGVINEHLARVSGGKVSFTHLIAWAVVRALGSVPALNACFIEDLDGKKTPGVLHRRHVGLGIAIDVERADGTRSLLVPVIRQVESMDFSEFMNAYEDLIRRARSRQLVVEDFAGATLSITNPGTLGTSQSVPRLMRGQGAIIGIGALDYPPEYNGVDPGTLAAIGIGKVVTLTSTYDHRVIQGAESGLFLRRVHELLVGEGGFYEEIFAALGVPSEPIRWQLDRNPIFADKQGEVELDKQLQVQSLIQAYRERGHLVAQLDPLTPKAPVLPAELELESYGLSVWDYNRVFRTGGLGGTILAPLARILEILRDAYCRTVGVEYMYIRDPEIRAWVQAHVEGVPSALAPDEQNYILDRLNAAEAFEAFLHARYIGQKRFGLEGAESTIPFIDAVVEQAARASLAEVVIGMAHRGRLNVLANIVGKSYEEIFAEFEGNLDPETVQGSGDVKYHKGAVGKWVGRDGLSLPVAMASNPSHLEAVDPVVEGMARAKQDHLEGFTEYSVLPLLVHGDASFAGQGVVAETLNLSMLDGYHVGGTVHLVINNQLGFTTPPSKARSSLYATDIAKMIEVPIFHVNGDDPEACVRVARLAVAFRQMFHKDVVVDLLCYRRHGHNEGDDPSYTQPLMYKRIDEHRSVRKLYTETLIKRGDITIEQAEHALASFSALLSSALNETRADAPPHVDRLPERVDEPLPRLGGGPTVARATLDDLERQIHSVPEGFVLHPKLARQFEQRHQLFLSGEVDWALGEALALGSLVVEGVDVRLSGQDSRRGTFSHRHATLVDYETGKEYTPLAELSSPPVVDSSLDTSYRLGHFFARDSLLSEYAALGFEYGYSVEAQSALVCWEAQFGDFANGAQIIMDNFIAAAEEKWGQSSSLVLLLPHGYEGQGPEHSSARIERFLTLAANGNFIAVQPTTAAQYFHLLRAHAHQSIRRPLVVFTPKSLLRARQARSAVDAFVRGEFQEVLDDPWRDQGRDLDAVRRLVVASGRIAFDALERRDALVASGSTEPLCAILRIEQLSPWPKEQLASVLDRYPGAKEVVWLQDEPENMGAWTYVHERLHCALRGRFSLGHVSRPASGSPATGSHALHVLELERLLELSVGPNPAAS
jgi:2-oxoglutarate dehydrogenase E1 component